MTFLLHLLLFIPLVYAANATVSVWDDSNKYKYFGCYNETTQVPGSADTRALGGGIQESLPGAMTVPTCLAFCGNGATEYRYAGLEWSRYVSLISFMAARQEGEHVVADSSTSPENAGAPRHCPA